MEWVNVLIQVVLLGGLYALFAAGLSLMFGVMRFVNIAHGDFIVLAAYLMLSFVTFMGWHPALGIVAVVLVMGTIGYLGQRILLNRVLGKDILPPILVTFGLSIILQNGMMEVFSADSRRVSSGALDVASISLPGDLAIGAMPLLMFVVALGVLAGLHVLFFHTALGRLLRATSDDAEMVPLMGGNKAHIFALATMIASGVVAVAGIISFVGLMVPHLVRPLTDRRPSSLIVPSALAGGLIVLVADSVLRALPLVSELRLGIALSLIGAPFFLWLLLRLRRGGTLGLT